jgi:hypothetical protein
MTKFSFLSGKPQEAVEAAARSLVSVMHGAESSTIALPMIYPSGAVATVEAKRVASDVFQITDCGLAYDEIEMIGGEHLFARNASAVAEKFEISAGRRTLYVSADVEQLADQFSIRCDDILVRHIGQRQRGEVSANSHR